MVKEIILAIIMSNAALLGFFQFLIQRHDQNKRDPEIENIKGALRSMLAESLNRSLNEWIHADERPHTTWDIIADQYEYYHDKFNGNHGIEQLYEVAKEIPPTE